MTTAFVPKPYPRTRLRSGCVLSDAQQYQYDVLRSVGGKLVNEVGWWREVGLELTRERVFGLNLTAMWKLVEMGLVDCLDGHPGYLFILPEMAANLPGPRYVRRNRIVVAVTLPEKS